MNEAPTLTTHRVILGELSRDGNARADIVVNDADGQPAMHTLSVPAGLPGEDVTITVEWPHMSPPKRHRRRWKPRPPRAWITTIHLAAPERVAAPCPVFGECGGCQLQHMDYAAQLAWKRGNVARLLKEIGGFDDPPLLDTVPCSTPWNYRNHMRFSVNRDGQPGLTARGTHRVLPLSHCPIAHEQINRALRVLSSLPNARPQVLIRCGAATGQVMIQPQPSPDAAQQLEEAGLDLHRDVMEERLGGATFRIRPSSFFQTNTAQAEQMMSMVVRGLLEDVEESKDSEHERRPSTLVDAYCGVGTFSRILARYADKVIAIEESPSAIRDAQWNLQGLGNVEIHKGKVEEVLPTLAEVIDGLVIDPPRAGCQRVVLEALLAHPVRRIVYVSCDPSTLARDLNMLCHSINSINSTYRLRSVQPLDMFPHTAHIECVAVLEQQNV
jgi:23S rRNA (uracil1939-C5)-methyltransferase